MIKKHWWIIFLAPYVSVFLSCKKEMAESVLNNENQIVANNANSTNTRLLYADTIFYLKNQPGNYIVTPVSIPQATGYFKANPVGLSLDSVTGKINVTLSETGMRYKVYYLDQNNQPLDSVKLVVSGIDYQDSIYRLQATANTYDTAFPIYNAKPGVALPCSDDDDDDDENQCIFDETDLDDDGNDDISGVNQEKLLVDTKRGTIDAEASFHAGVFGSSDPANGVTKDFTFYYRITDASNRALNKITVRLYHYKRVADIPQWLLDEISSRKNTATQVNARGESGGISAQGRLSLIDFKPKRPPIIVIVSQ